MNTTQHYLNVLLSFFMHREKNVQPIEIPTDRTGQRIDNWLFTLLNGVPKSRIYRAIRRGEVRVNKKRAKAAYKLVAGDRVRIPPLKLNTTVKPHIQKATIDWLLPRIVYEDETLLVLNKPAGIAVHAGSHANFGVIDVLRQARNQPDLALVHRLDKATSGCLIIAKHQQILRQLHELLRNGAIIKEYICLVKGKWESAKQRVTLPLRKNRLHSGEYQVQVDVAGKPAVTEFSLCKAAATASLLHARLHTGRTHQIRVHLQQLSHPIAGDEKYGDYTFNRQMSLLGLRRLFLHARIIKFRLPGVKKAITVEAPLEKDLVQCWKQLDQGNLPIN